MVKTPYFKPFLSHQDQISLLKSRGLKIADENKALHHSLVYVRNMCAHHARIWSRWLRIQPLFPKNAANTWITNSHARNNRLFFTLSMIIYLLNVINPTNRFKQKLEILFKKYPNVDRSAMGFPSNWRSEALWK
jgi:abortive infection bacteriophage resistance protein